MKHKDILKNVENYVHSTLFHEYMIEVALHLGVTVISKHDLFEKAYRQIFKTKQTVRMRTLRYNKLPWRNYTTIDPLKLVPLPEMNT